MNATIEQLDETLTKKGFFFDDENKIAHRYISNLPAQEGREVIVKGSEFKEYQILTWLACGHSKIELTELGGPVFPIEAPPAEDKPRIARIQDLPWIFDVVSKEVKWVVNSLIPVGTITLVTGKYESGKSSWVDSMLYKISRGEPFMGLETTKTPVVILDRDNPGAAVMDRFKRLGITERSPYFNVWGQWSGDDVPTGDDPRLLAYVEECEVRPIVLIDSFISFHGGKSENDAHECEAHMMIYRKLTARGASVVLNHHVGKSGENSRGSTAIPGAVDTALRVTKIGAEGDLLKDMNITKFKQRIAIEEPGLVRYEDGQFTKLNRPVVASDRDKLINLLLTNAGTSRKDFETLAKGARIPRERARTFIENGIADKSLVEVEGEGELKANGKRGRKSKRLFWGLLDGLEHATPF